MQSVFGRLVPQPRKLTPGVGTFTSLSGGCIAFLNVAASDGAPAALFLQKTFGTAWTIIYADAVRPECAITFEIVPQVAGAESYRLQILPSGVRVQAEDRAGLLYAAVTLAQIKHLAPSALPAVVIEDAPDFSARGVMLDISRDKVPTMTTLYALVDLFASLKLNQLQLYTEHTFAYCGHEEVWREASPMTPTEVQQLDRYCRERCMELVPNQNSFGHLERWLTLPRYNCLAELPQGGAPLPWGGVHEKPTALCPTDPRSLELLADLYDQLLPNFASRLFNVGCDETFDLRGNGRSAARVRQVGEGRVYLDFLKKIHDMVTARERRMLFWGDIIINHPELVSELPHGAIALEWGYEAEHPFEAHGALYAAAGVEFYVCPGTSAWNSLAGRTTNMRANLFAAAESGRRHGASGYLITDWGDGGHWQPFAVSLPGYLYGAALAWGCAANRTIDLALALDDFAATQGLGETLLELGDLYLKCGALRGNGTELFQILARPSRRKIADGVSAENLEMIMRELDQIWDSILETPHSIMRDEIEQVVRLMHAACQRGLVLLGSSNILGIGYELENMAMNQARVWLLRNRTGGLAASLTKLPTSAKTDGLP